MSLTRLTNKLGDAFLSLAFPQPCTLCCQSVESRLYEPVCTDCWSVTRIFQHDEAVCWKCGIPIRGGLRSPSPEEINCHRCNDHAFVAARACGVYAGALRESVLLLKRQPRISEHLVRLLVAVADRPPLNSTRRLIPVPLHPEREARRGFNQAEVIAQAIGPRLGLTVDRDSLIRVTASQMYRAGLDSQGRFDTVANAFSVRFPLLVAGEEILLVDDVFTTGATASSCASALLACGASKVTVLTIARPEW